MSHILLVTSSPRGAASYSTKVARTLAEKLAGGDPKSITVRDLSRQPLPHIGEAFTSGIFTPPEHRTPAQQAEIARSDAIIAEVAAADVIVIGSAMINFGLSTALKSWIDHLVRKDATFRYTEKGPEGLLRGKKVYIVQASGGVYSDGPMVSFNFQDPYLRRILGFIGITDVEVIAIEGVAFGPEAAEKAVAAAAAKASAIAPHKRSAAA